MQHTRNVAAANRARSERARLRKAVHAGELSPLDVLDDPPKILQDVDIFRFLTWIPGLRQHRAHALCTEAGISPFVTLGELRRDVGVGVRHQLLTTVAEYEDIGRRQGEKMRATWKAREASVSG